MTTTPLEPLPDPETGPEVNPIAPGEPAVIPEQDDPEPQPEPAPV